jgi:hypothetical protein
LSKTALIRLPQVAAENIRALLNGTPQNVVDLPIARPLAA